MTKRLGQVVGLLALALLALTPPALAGNIVLRAGGSLDTPSGAATRTLNTGTNHRYYTVDYADATDSCTLFHFTPFTDYPTNGDIQGTLFYMNSATCNAQSFSVQMSISCPTASSTNYDTLTFTDGTAFTANTASTANTLMSTPIGSSALDETTASCNIADQFVVKVCRDGDGSLATDSCAGTMKLVGLRLTY